MLFFAARLALKCDITFHFSHPIRRRPVKQGFIKKGYLSYPIHVNLQHFICEPQNFLSSFFLLCTPHSEVSTNFLIVVPP